MMTNLNFEQKKYIGNILEELAKTIDLTDAQYEDAMSRYKTIGEFLSDASCGLAAFGPKIVPQGSMRIGTVTRPVDPECEFDVDANCRLEIATPTMQYNIKQLVGNCFRKSKVYEPMLEEKKRCWRICYSESSRFHLDVVPAIPDNYEFLLQLGVPHKYASHAVLITDVEHEDYHTVSHELPKSNPEGYALWFLDIMRIQADSIRMKLAAELRMSVQQVPDFKVRTPLQRAIQLMKRHRDLMFGDDELKPISIIITTLAARAYEEVMRRNDGGLFYDILTDIVQQMPLHIKLVGGIKWVANPVNPGENFADKWQSNLELEREFYRWHGAMMASLRSEQLKAEQPQLVEHLKLSYGARSVNETFNREADRLTKLRTAAGLISSSTAFTDSYGNIGAAGTVKNVGHSFHFSNPIRIPRHGSYKYANLSHQKHLIETNFQFLKCTVKNKVLRCTGYIKPEGCNQSYKILIEQVAGKEPKTTILEPWIKPSSKIHMYADHSLCLSYPKETKWTENTKVYEHTIPWLVEWIIYYELYLVNGNIWEGRESSEHLTEATMNFNRDED